MSTRVVHHNNGYRSLLTDPRIQADLMRRAQAIARAAGPDATAVQSPPRRRARAAVVAPNGDPDNMILHSLDAGR